MARPTKSVAALSDYSQTKGETAARKEMENRLKKDGVPVAPEYLTEDQKKIFDRIIYLLEDTGMIALNDVWVIAKAAVAIDRVSYFEGHINKGHMSPTDKEVIGALRFYTSDFHRCCNELCLSPQSRAKLANTAASVKQERPLKALFDEAGKMI